MSLKQTIEDHPVVIYAGAVIVGFIAGWAACKAMQSPIPDDLNTVSPSPVLVQLDGVDVREGNGCNPPYSFVVEKFRLLSEEDPSVFIMTNGSSYESMEVRKLDEIFKVDPTGRGWQIGYCSIPGPKRTFLRKFYNTRTGASSETILVEVDV